MGILWKNKYRNLKPSPIMTVIIAAAGSGARMGGISKPFISLCGKSALHHCLDSFCACPYTAKIVISAKAEDIPKITSLISEKAFPVPITVAEGGESRQESVLKAFKHAFSNHKDVTPFIAIHDAARPLITAKKIEEAVKTALRYGSAVCAAKVKDTLKRTDKAGVVCESVEREDLWHIQTPQIFDFDIFHTALSKAIADNVEATDESSLVSAAGFKVQLVECGHENLKITYPEDIEIANAILSKRV